jgi:hypothetical protein
MHILTRFGDNGQQWFARGGSPIGPCSALASAANRNLNNTCASSSTTLHTYKFDHGCRQLTGINMTSTPREVGTLIVVILKAVSVSLEPQTASALNSIYRKIFRTNDT